MMRSNVFLLGCCALFGPVHAAQASPRVSIGVNIGAPPVVIGPRPYYYPRYYHPYRYPRPIYYEPAPIIVRPAPVVYQQAPVVIPSPVVAAPAPVPFQASSSSSVAPAVSDNPTNVDAHLHLLRNPDEKVRSDAALDLGRTRSERAVDPLAATLSGDKSPVVRDAAARALGLLGSPRGLTALTHAAGADPDRDVRRSAQFSVEVIQSRRE